MRIFFPILKRSSSIFTVIIVIIITALIVGGGVYVWQKQALKRKEIAPQTQIIVPQPTLTSKHADWQTYTNSEFGFTLKFPPAWQTMKIERGERGFGPGLENPSIMFSLKGLTTKDEEFIKLRGKSALEFGVDLTFSINAHSSKQWQELSRKMEQGEPIGLTYLGGNSQYVFSWERNMRPLCLGAEEDKLCQPPSDIEPRWKEIEEIVTTLRVL